MTRHAAGHGVNGVLHFRVVLLRHEVCEFLDLVLALGHGHTVPWHDDDLLRTVNHHRNFIGVRPDLGAGDGFLVRPAERREQHVRECPVHGFAHDERQDQTACTDQGTSHDEDAVADDEASKGCSNTGK